MLVSMTSHCAGAWDISVSVVLSIHTCSSCAISVLVVVVVVVYLLMMSPPNHPITY